MFFFSLGYLFVQPGIRIHGNRAIQIRILLMEKQKVYQFVSFFDH